MAEKVFVKEIPSDPDLLPEIEEYILEIAKEVKLDEEKFNNLTLSVTEAASNSIVHGNKMDAGKKVIITVRVDEKNMTISIKDQGNGFDPSKVPDPTKPENILKDSGRGIHIMRSFLDDLRYNFTPEGTEVTLVISLK